MSEDKAEYGQTNLSSLNPDKSGKGSFVFKSVENGAIHSIPAHLLQYSELESDYCKLEFGSRTAEFSGVNVSVLLDYIIEVSGFYLEEFTEDACLKYGKDSKNPMICNLIIEEAEDEPEE